MKAASPETGFLVVLSFFAGRAVLAGGLAEALGPQFGLAVIALTCIGITILLFFFIPALRKIN